MDKETFEIVVRAFEIYCVCYYEIEPNEPTDCDTKEDYLEVFKDWLDEMIIKDSEYSDTYKHVLHHFSEIEVMEITPRVFKLRIIGDAIAFAGPVLSTQQEDNLQKCKKRKFYRVFRLRNTN